MFRVLADDEGRDQRLQFFFSSRRRHTSSKRDWSSDVCSSDLKFTINYGYRQFNAGTDEKAALTKILDDAWAQDLRYMTNQDTDSNPKVDQWSSGVDQADELLRLMKVRRSALNRLGEHTIRAGAPMATIEEPLVPIYMYHRYAVESTASMVGGQDYIYAVRGDRRTPTKGVGVD